MNDETANTDDLTIYENSSNQDSEEENIGKIKRRDIWRYLEACGKTSFLMLMVSLLICTATQVYTNIWLSAWVDCNIGDCNDLEGSNSMTSQLFIYGGLALLSCLCILLLTFCIAIGSVRASRYLHEQLMFKLLRAPMAFFDVTPIGRILTRLSKDLDVVDCTIGLDARLLLFSLMPMLSTFIIVIYVTPLTAIVICVLVLVYYYLQRVYIFYARQLTRIEAVRRAPILSHITESYTGIASIRAYQKMSQFTDHCYHLIDNSTKPYVILIAAMRAMSIYSEFIGIILIFFTSLFVVLFRDSVSSGQAALSITFTLQVIACMNMSIRFLTQSENNMVSVERIFQYIDIESEALWETTTHNIGCRWPLNGGIKLTNYAAKYRDGNDLVLKNINIEINPHEKIGVVGRTGAGKSSLVLGLFRIFEASLGCISIDGVKLDIIGLHQLRKAITIIPQDPVIFNTTIRKNIDPTGAYSDTALWNVIEQVHMKNFLIVKEEGLNYECGEGGENLSLGQRQLLCLSRALLRNTNILVLDEATSAVDHHTDKLVQTIIRENFQHCTTITIAHRLATVKDCDRILVLSAGTVAEFGTPQDLLNDPDSLYSAMVHGHDMADI